MLNITDAATLARALDSPISEAVKALLQLRRAQLLSNLHDACDVGELARFVVVEADDDIETIETAVGYPVVRYAAFEWVVDHGGVLEAVTILSDDGFATVLIVPLRAGVDRMLLAALYDYLAPASASDRSRSGNERSPTR